MADGFQGLEVTLYDSDGTKFSFVSGAAVGTLVIPVAGTDGSVLRGFAVDSSGRLKTLTLDGSGNVITSTGGFLQHDIASQTLTALKVSATSAANAVGNPIFSRLTDGTTGTTVKAASTAAVSTDPALVVAISPNNTLAVANASIGANGSAIPGSSTQVGGSDGTLLRAMAVDTSGRLKTLTLDGSGTAITSTGSAMDVNLKTSSINIPVSLAAQSLTAVTISATSAANTLANPIFNRQSDANGNTALVQRNTAPAANQGVFPTGVFDGTNMQLLHGDGSGRADVRLFDTTGTAITQTGGSLNVSVQGIPNEPRIGGRLDVTSRIFDAFGVGLTSSASAAGVQALDVANRTGQVAATWEAVHIYQEATIAVTTAATQILTYTVTAGKVFYLLGFNISQIDLANAVDGAPLAITVNGVNFLRAYLRAGVGGSTTDQAIEWGKIFPQGIPIASGTQVIKLVVTQSVAASKIWGGALWGIEK